MAGASQPIKSIPPRSRAQEGGFLRQGTPLALHHRYGMARSHRTWWAGEMGTTRGGGWEWRQDVRAGGGRGHPRENGQTEIIKEEILKKMDEALYKKKRFKFRVPFWALFLVFSSLAGEQARWISWFWLFTQFKRLAVVAPTHLRQHDF